MGKRFKLRISQVIHSFQSCRSNDTSTLPEHPVPVFFKISPTCSDEIAVDLPPRTGQTAHRSSFNRNVSSAFSSLGGCGFRSKSGARGNRRSQSLAFHWEKEEQWHVVAKTYDETPRRKIYNSSVSGDSDEDDGSMILPSLLPLPLPASERKKRRAKKKKYSKFRHRMSTSSAESGLFSSESFDEREEEEEEETETLVSSSRSFSTDSSTDFNPQLETIRETTAAIPRRHRKNNNNNNKNKKRTTTNSSRVPKVGMTLCRSSSVTSPECASPARLSVFKKLIPGDVVEGKVKESFAVVKKSEDPLEDFKRSMMEMIVEKEMFEERDLEQLLQCFLSLNSRCHHGVIVEAFSEIWDTIFGTTKK